MDPIKKSDLKKMRAEFAQRLGALIGDKSNPENLKDFHEKTGRPLPKLSQWRNPEHLNWPDMKSFLQICLGAQVSPSWLLLGKGKQYLSEIGQPKNLNWADAKVQIVQQIRSAPEKERYELLNEIAEVMDELAEESSNTALQTAYVSEKIGRYLTKDSAGKTQRTTRESGATGHGGKKARRK